MDLEDGYTSSTGSVDEEDELELSCALHDLALRVKNFEVNMQGRFRQRLDEEDEEITEDIEHFEEDGGFNCYGMDLDAACKDSRRRRVRDYKLAKTQQDDEEDGEDLDLDEIDRPEVKGGDSSEEEWDSQEEKEELCELKQNIAKLLQSMQEEAKSLENNQADCKT